MVWRSKRIGQDLLYRLLLWGTIDPHGHNQFNATHVVASRPEMACRMVEYLIEKMSGNYQYFDKNPVIPKKGMISLSESPVFGIELDESKIENIKFVL